MKKIILKALLFFGIISALGCNQQEKIINYKGENFSLSYPASWQTTNDDGILNFFPIESYGAVTISSYKGITFPIEKTKELILETNKVKDNPEHVIMIKKQDVVEFYYENVDDTLKWVTRAIRKNTDFYLITINCELKRWESNKASFTKVLESFKLN